MTTTGSGSEAGMAAAAFGSPRDRKTTSPPRTKYQIGQLVQVVPLEVRSWRFAVRSDVTQLERRHATLRQRIEPAARRVAGVNVRELPEPHEKILCKAITEI